VWQPSLLDAAAPGPAFDRTFRTATRTELTAGAWVEVAPDWVSGADTLFAEIVQTLPWSRRTVPMYGRMVDEPRLTARFSLAAPADAHEGELGAALRVVFTAMAAALTARFGRAFDSVGAALYRDGRDSVAWHGDTHGRGSRFDTIVAIISFGSPRSLMLRPRGGGPSLRFPVGHGDLLVMGGSCQRTWEHCVPKTTRPVGPRISVQFRHRGVS
jgi:alkylated DNA repair dioxygenase AlkB